MPDAPRLAARVLLRESCCANSVVSFDFACRVAEFIDIPGAIIGAATGLGRDSPRRPAFFGERHVAGAALEGAQVRQAVKSDGFSDQSHRLGTARAPRRLWRGIVDAFGTHGEARFSVRASATSMARATSDRAFGG
jgi:hypothetical protein